MAEYKCGDCFHAELCEKSEILDGFSRENPAYCGMFINSSDVVKVRHGRWMNANSRPKTYWRRCTACGGLAYFCGIGCSYKYCPNCGADMRGSNDE